MAYDSEDKLTRLSWDEYGKKVDELFEKVNKYLKKNKIKLSAIVPILREGVFVGLPFAYKFNTWKIMPVQYKYFLKKGISPYDQVPTLLADIPKLGYKLPRKPVFLVTDVWPGGGRTATATGKKLKKKFPGCKLIYVCMMQDVAFKKPKEYVAAITHSHTDDTGQLSEAEKKKRGIITEFYLMPWHNAKEELAPVLGKKYDYDF